MQLKVPYNFCYGDRLLEQLYTHRSLISSLYFSFSKGSRPLPKNTPSLDNHLAHIEKIKSLLDIEVFYALNSVIPNNLDSIDFEILLSGVVDVVTVARDDVYFQIEQFIGSGVNANFVKYETSRFYNYIKENTGELKNASDYVVYGFKKEIPPILDKNKKYGFIANENCYPDCDKKLEHNSEVVERNINGRQKTFTCPYKDKRVQFSEYYIRTLAEAHGLTYLKLCDRTMTDDELMGVFNKWIPFADSFSKKEAANV